MDKAKTMIDVAEYKRYRALGYSPSVAAGAARRHTPGTPTGIHLGLDWEPEVGISEPFKCHTVPAKDVPGMAEWCQRMGFDPEWVSVSVSTPYDYDVDITEELTDCGFTLEKVTPRNWRDSDYSEYPVPPVPWAIQIDYSGPQERSNPMWLYADASDRYTPLKGAARGHDDLRRNEMLREVTERHANYIRSVLRGDVSWHNVDVAVVYDGDERGTASLGRCEHNYACKDVNPHTGRRYCFDDMVRDAINEHGLIDDALEGLVKWADERPGRVASRDVVRNQLPLFPGM